MDFFLFKTITHNQFFFLFCHDSSEKSNEILGLLEKKPNILAKVKGDFSMTIKDT